MIHISLKIRFPVLFLVLVLLPFPAFAQERRILAIDNLQVQSQRSQYVAQVVEENGQRYLEIQGSSPLYRPNQIPPCAGAVAFPPCW